MDIRVYVCIYIYITATATRGSLCVIELHYSSWPIKRVLSNERQLSSVYIFTCGAAIAQSNNRIRISHQRQFRHRIKTQRTELIH